MLQRCTSMVAQQEDDMSEFGQALNVEQPLLAIEQPIVVESITKLVEKLVGKK